MRIKLATLTVLAAVALWCAGQAYAQTQNVQITSGPTSTNATANSAVIVWSTNVPSSAVVKYGLSPNNLDQTAEAPWGGTNHSVTLNGLQPGQRYYYQVTSSQGQGTGTGAISSIQGFNTAASGQASATGQPATTGGNSGVVAGPIVQNLTPSSAQVVWLLSQPAATVLKYGTDRSFTNNTQTLQATGQQQQQTQQLSNLQPGTQYYLSVQLPDGRELGFGQFQTPAAGQQQTGITNGPTVESITPNSVVIAWSTERPSSSVVMYGSQPNDLSQRAQAPWGQTTHRVTVNNLQPDTTYWFAVQSGETQGTGTSAQSQPFEIRTLSQGQQTMSLKQ